MPSQRRANWYLIWMKERPPRSTIVASASSQKHLDSCFLLVIGYNRIYKHKPPFDRLKTTKAPAPYALDSPAR